MRFIITMTLGGGARLFDDLGGLDVRLEPAPIRGVNAEKFPTNLVD